MGTARRSAVVVRPTRRILQRRGSLAIALITLPPFLALYWLTAATGGWRYVVVVHALTVAVVLLAAWRLRRISITIDEDGIRRCDALGRDRFTPAADVRSAVVVRVLSANSEGTTPHLFVLDGTGRAVLRMRGSFWSRVGLAAVERALDVPVQHLPSPVGKREFRLGFWRNLDFYERHPAVTAALFGAAGVLVATPVLVEINSLL